MNRKPASERKSKRIRRRDVVFVLAVPNMTTAQLLQITEESLVKALVKLEVLTADMVDSKNRSDPGPVFSMGVEVDKACRCVAELLNRAEAVKGG